MKGKKHRVSWTDRFCSIIESPIKCRFNSRLIPLMTWSSTYQSYWMPLTCLYVITFCHTSVSGYYWWICSVQSENLHNLEIALRILRILRLHTIVDTTRIHFCTWVKPMISTHPSMTEQPAFTVCHSTLKHYRSVDTEPCNDRLLIVAPFLVLGSYEHRARNKERHCYRVYAPYTVCSHGIVMGTECRWPNLFGNTCWRMSIKDV